MRIQSALFCLIPLAAACGGDGNGGGGTAPPVQECQPVLSANSAVPGTTVTISGIAAASDAPTGIVTGSGASAPVVVLRDSTSGGLSLIVPLHPSAGAAGGATTLTLTLGATACRPVNFTVAPLPAAPGASEATVDAMQASVTSAAAAFGLTPEQLMGDTAGVPHTLRGLQMAQRILDHPGNPNSVRAMLAGTAPALKGRKVDADLLGRLMASTGLRASMEAYMAETAASIALQASDTSLAPIGARPAPGAANAGAAELLAPRTIDSGYSLAIWMKRQGEAQARMNDRVKDLMEKLETFLAVVAVTGPTGAAAAAIVTTTVMSAYVANAYLDGALPHALTDLVVDAFPLEYPEDWALEGHWRARVNARSKGVSLSLSTVLSEAAGKLAGWAKIGKLAKNPKLEDALQEMWTTAVSSLTSALGIQGNAIEIPPQTWALIDVTDQRYTRRELSTQGVVALSGLGADWAYYKPVAPGQTTLTVATFPTTLNSQLSKALNLRVQQIGIIVEPLQSQVRVGTEQLVAYRISGALDNSVTWTASCGRIVHDGGAFARYTAPSAPATCTVTARHTVKKERSGSAQIQAVQTVTINVTPGSVALAPGELQTFTAQVEGTQNTAVTWAASRGSINSQGVFTAPPDTGLITVTATSVADPTQSGSAQVRVRSASVTRGHVLHGGFSRSCVIGASGPIYCWGQGDFVDPRVDRVLAPTPVAGAHAFVATSGNEATGCGLVASGDAYCWGEMGESSSVPTLVPGGRRFTEISVGTRRICAITAAGEAYCWGENIGGSLGVGSSAANVATPMRVVGEQRFASISSGSGYSCALTAAGAAYCWGRTLNGRLGNGDGSEATFYTAPAAVLGGHTFTQIATGVASTCALSVQGQAYCWGDNRLGSVGDGTTSHRAVPTAVTGGLSFVTVRTSNYFSCGVTSAGAAYCWGQNSHGMLGDGSTTNRSAPAPVSGGTRFVIVEPMVDHTCGITPGGQAYCWGQNHYGQLGDGTTTNRLVPTATTGGITFRTAPGGTSRSFRALRRR